MVSADPTAFLHQPMFPIVSDRNIPLIFSGKLHELMIPVVTVELYVKWYKLFVIKQVLYDEVIVEVVDFPGEEYCAEGETAYGDHVPNPRVVSRFASRNGYRVDEVALEVIIGRWEREHLNNYSDLEEEPCHRCGKLGSACKCAPGGL